MKRILLVCFLACSVAFQSYAQEKTVSGTVVSNEDNTGLPAVNIIVKGTTTGTTTDLDGNYKLTVPTDEAVLIFSSIGFENQEIIVGSQSVINLTLRADVTQLGEVVVTALGISREKAGLGYAVQQVDGDAVNTVKDGNFINSLSGKVAGVQIKQNNNFGGSTNVIIRGNSSITGSNQALFVVDGVPINNGTYNETDYQRDGRYGFDYGNAASDINPEDVESISVLKGAAASALYGSRAANGVVLVTTKKGKARKGIGVSFNTGYTAGKIDKKTFIEYQDQYGAGYGKYYGSTGDFFDIDVNGDGVDDFVVPTTEDGSYGGKFDPNLMVYTYDSFIPESDRYLQPSPWVAAENTPVDFFETANTFNNSIALTGGDEKANFRLSYTNYTATGVMPNSEMKRNNVSFNGSTQLTDKFKVSTGINFNVNDNIGRNSTGYGGNMMGEFRQWWQTNVDVKRQKDLYFKTKRNVTWNPIGPPAELQPIFWDNLYWTRYENYQSDERTRMFGNIMLSYDLKDWLKIEGRASLDTYNELREERLAVGSVAGEFGNIRPKQDETSGYQRKDLFVSERNYDLMLTANKDLTPDLTLYAMLGFNLRQNDFESVQGATAGGLAVPGLYKLSNSLNTPPLPIEEDTQKEVYGYYTSVNLGYKNMLYFDGTFRYDISSALPISDNAYPYYSASVAWVFTEAFSSNWLDFGKVRVGGARVANDLAAGNTSDFFIRNPNFGPTIITSAPNTKNNSELVPETTDSYEFGLELAALDNRVSLDLAVYTSETNDLLTFIEVSQATGYRFKLINGGSVENKGIELTLGGDIIRNNDWNWHMDVNFARNRNKVLSLSEGVDNYVLNSYQGGISANATVGQPFGVLKGTGFEYLNGEKVVDANGYYKAVADQIIADPNPDFIGGINNRVTYKGIALSFLIDMQQGGDVYSLDMHYGQGTGLPVHTTGLNDLGNDFRLPVAEGGGIKQPGVKEDGTENDIYARADYFGGVFYWGNSSRNPAALTVYDASFVKLRELAISYTLPNKWINSFANRVEFSLVGRNLAILHKNLPYADPESGLSAGNAQGYLSGSYPTVRSTGFALKVDF
ncbi:MAG: SusC/RagA family TonB-linked outer membrane protein [Cyclobacteriaceae bacterium]|nr:MAG: SusC/RagA family TonB-linked outer membrane protein [Cyclobacteriaceae bacterium]